ncbi:MAG: hypothetical protein M9894_39950 [Planctomycetes bacterium]|nr:hypothetical protein [Planctomycetota bacterium]
MDSRLRVNAERLAQFVAALRDFEWRPRRSCAYNHIGATLSDTTLQAGLSYRSVVLPRVQRILRRWPAHARTTHGLLRVIEDEGAEVFLKWKHHEKPRRLAALAGFFLQEGVDDEPTMGDWLRSAENRSRLMSLKGVGPKTVDYLGVLVGTPTLAVDRHVRTLSARAGVVQGSYDGLKAVAELAAEILSVDLATFDASIWHYVSTRAA